MALISESWKFDITAIVVLLLATLYLYLKWEYSYWERKGVKTLPGVNYLWGHWGPMFTQKENLAEITLRHYRSTNEPFIGLYGFLRRMLMVRDTELIHSILIKDFAHFTDRGDEINEDYDPLTGNIVNLPGHKWRPVRSKLTPTFTSGKLKSMFSTLLECGASMESYLQNVAEKGELLDVVDITVRNGTNTTATVFFGIDVDTIKNPNHDFRKYGQKIFETSTWNFIKRLSRTVAPKFIRFFRIKFADQGMESFIFEIVKQNLEYREKNNIARKDFFQLLIQLRNTGTVQLDNEWETVIKADNNQKKMSMEEVTAHSFAFFGAGFETSSSTVSFCLYELTKNPELQERARNEIKTVLEKHNGQITYESVLDMKYLSYCIDETLRMYNITPTIRRKCVKDYQIPGTDVIIEKDDLLIFPAYALHRDEKYYPNPDKFIPDRFNEENSAGKNQVNRPYLPFGDGPRNCIGMRLGKMQALVGLIIMLKNFRYELDDSLKGRDMEFALRSTLLSPREGIRMKIFKI